MPKSQLDWLGVVTLWLGALIMAVKAGGLDAPPRAPPFLSSEVWNYVPLALTSIAVAVFIYRQLNPLKATAIPPQPIPAPSAASFAADVASVSEAKDRGGREVLVPPTQPAHDGQRRFAPDMVVKQFCSLVKRNPTDAQIKAFLKPHSGEWMRLKGYFYSHSSSYTTDLISLSLSEEGGGIITVDIDHQWSDHLAKYEIGDEMLLDVLLVDRGYKVRLEKAELR